MNILADRVLGGKEALELWNFQPVYQEPTITTRETGSITISDRATGNVMAYVSKLPDDLRANVRKALTRIPRGKVVRSRGGESSSTVIGFLAPNAMLSRRSRGIAAAAVTFPNEHKVLMGLSQWCADEMAKVLPTETAAHQNVISNIQPGWRIPGGLWTSGIINFTSPYVYHRDRNNIPGSWSAMPIIRRNATGGYLHLPEFEIDGKPAVFACDDGDAIFFDGQEVMHGVTPIEVTGDGYRISTVFYAVKKMQGGNAPEQELHDVRKRRTLLDEQSGKPTNGEA